MKAPPPTIANSMMRGRRLLNADIMGAVVLRVRDVVCDAYLRIDGEMYAQRQESLEDVLNSGVFAIQAHNSTGILGRLSMLFAWW